MAALSASSPRVPVRRRDIEIAHLKGDAGASGARSYLADDRLVTWLPASPAGMLIAVPRSLGRRFGAKDPLDFWRLWTTNEVAAKLLDIPILLWLTRYGLRRAVRGVSTRTLEIDDVVISCGWCPVDARHTLP